MLDEDELQSLAEIQAKEDGIYTDYLYGRVTANEYEEFIDNVILSLVEEEIQQKTKTCSLFDVTSNEI